MDCHFQLIHRLRLIQLQTPGNVAWFMLLMAAHIFMGTAPLYSQSIPAEITVSARVNTGAVSGDADDPAIWIHPTDPAQSLIIGTDKVSNFLYVWDMSGQQLQRISITNEPNNVDLRSGMVVGGEMIDICVVNAQDPSRLVVFKIDPNTRTLINISAGSGVPISELKNPYGLCLYRRPSDGAMFAFGTTNGGDQRNIHQYRLMDNGSGKVTGVHVRAFGSTDIGGVMEGLVADDEPGYVYAAEEDCCIHKFYADPDLNNNTQLAAFAQADGIDPDREGLGLYACPDGAGYILLSSQGNKRVKVYRREGDPGNPHSHTLVTTIYTPNVGGTDGLDVTNLPAGPNFPYGLLAKHNSTPKNFALIAWEDIAKTYLTICPDNVSCDVAADFSASAASSCAPLMVNFTDLSTSPSGVTSWSWDFGDGGTSTSQNPSHLYAAAGIYTVKLTVTNACGSDDESKVNYVVVSDCTPSNVARGKTATASSSSSGDPASRAVDGSTSTKWKSNAGGTQWLEVDLGSTYETDNVVIRWDGSRRARDFQFQYFNSTNSTWVTLYSQTNNGSSTSTFSFTSTCARRFRVNMTRGNSSRYGINEFEIRGCPCTAASSKADGASLQEPAGFKPDEIALEQNYPNPFNPSTTIRFSLPNETFVSLKVYNVMGEEVATLVKERQHTGHHSVVFEAQHLPSGIYFAVLQADEVRAVQRLLLMK